MPLDRPLHLILIENEAMDGRAIDGKTIVRACAGIEIACELTCFGDGQEALAALRGDFGAALQMQPFLILLDLNLPQMDGIDFLDELRADPVWRRSIVFVFTTSRQDADKAAAYDRRVAGYLVKGEHSFDYSALCQLLEVYEKSVQFPTV